MEYIRGSKGRAVSCLVVVGSLLGGCGKSSPTEATNFKTSNQVTTVSNDKNIEKSLATIREKFEGKSHLLVLEKSFWVNKLIWVSIGVERSSVTGIAGSVMGYLPTYLRQTNGLLVLERDNSGRFAGSALTPDIALNAYPIVDENEHAIVVDIANPRSEYGLTNMGFYAGQAANTELRPRLEYVKDVSITNEGIAFKSVINAISPVPLYQPGQGSPEEAAGLDPFSLSMTIRTDWKIPSPTKDYSPLSADEQPVGFFYSAPVIEDGGLTAKRYVARIATNKQHVWEMSANTPAAYQKAVGDGVLAWNEVLGKDVLRVAIAKPNKDTTDPSTSNIIWDDNKAVGFAFANWRDNPHTGEIIQGQVYMSGEMWAEQAGLVYDMRRLEKLLRESIEAAEEAKETENEVTDPQQKQLIAKVRKLQKQLASSVAKLKKDLKEPAMIKRGFVSLNPNMHEEVSNHKGFCQREIKISHLRDLVNSISVQDPISGKADLKQELKNLEAQKKLTQEFERVLKHMPYPADDLPRETFQADVVRSVVMHEVGHALGLRHNFMGSLETSAGGKIESGSIMDYNDLVVDAQFDRVGDSDKVIVEMGYKRISPSKNIKICTDEHVAMGVPGCHRHDYSADPIDFYKTSQETNLLMSLFFASRGDSARLVRGINASLVSNLDMASYLNYPLELGLQIDENFKQIQAKALAAIVDSRTMYGLPFPQEIVAVYEGLSRLVLGMSVGEGAAQSEVKGALVSDLSQSVLDSKSLFGKDARLSAIGGLVKLQDGTARNALRTLYGTLADQSSNQQSGRDLDSRMMDEFVQGAVKNALDSYYAVGAQGNP